MAHVLSKSDGALGTEVVKAQYDKYLRMALRAQPVVGQFVTVYPVEPTAPGSSIILKRYNDLSTAAVPTPIAEDVDVDSEAIPATTNVTLTPLTYARSVTTTELLELESFTRIEPAKADLVARSLIDTREQLIMNVAVAGTNVFYAGAAGAIDLTGPTNAVVQTDSISAKQWRRAVTELRARNAPGIRGELYGALIHPRVAVDLREDATVGNWLLPHQYNANEAIWRGEVGTFEGAYAIETNRAYSALDGTASAKVYRTLMFGAEALAEAVVLPYQTVIGPVVDRLMRFRPLSWKATVGYAVYRQECVQRVESGATS